MKTTPKASTPRNAALKGATPIGRTGHSLGDQDTTRVDKTEPTTFAELQAASGNQWRPYPSGIATAGKP